MVTVSCSVSFNLTKVFFWPAIILKRKQALGINLAFSDSLATYSQDSFNFAYFLKSYGQESSTIRNWTQNVFPLKSPLVVFVDATPLKSKQSKTERSPARPSSNFSFPGYHTATPFLIPSGNVSHSTVELRVKFRINYGSSWSYHKIFWAIPNSNSCSLLDASNTGTENSLLQKRKKKERNHNKYNSLPKNLHAYIYIYTHTNV